MYRMHGIELGERETLWCQHHKSKGLYSWEEVAGADTSDFLSAVLALTFMFNYVSLPDIYI